MRRDNDFCAHDPRAIEVVAATLTIGPKRCDSFMPDIGTMTVFFTLGRLSTTAVLGHRAFGA
jgi:hypothetical protein